jgi:hypothetical protein
MPPHSPRTLLPLAVAAAVLLLVTACAPDRAESDDTDAQRLAALEAAPPFDATRYGASWAPEPARSAAASTNAVAYRGGIHTSFLVDAAEAHPALDPSWATVFPLGQSLLTELRANGWIPVYVACEAPASASSSGAVQIYATAPLTDADADPDAVVAAVSVRVGTGADEVDAEAVVPFHTEDPDPWGADALGNETCLDAAAPPDASTSAGSPLELSDVRR